MNRFFLLLFGVVSLVAHAQVPDYVPTEGLVAWYPFNGNANDESGNGHHAAIDGATLADDRYGNFDAAFYFDGSDRIIAPQNVSPEGNSARTINAFFKSYSALPVGNNQYSLQAIFGSGSAASGKVISSLKIDGNGTDNGHIPRTGHLYFSSGSWQDEAWSQESVSDSLWHMATMTYEGPNTPVRVYLDGQFQDETDPITLNTHLSAFYIGDVPWAVLFFNGLIDDLGVWNRALTDEEILALLGPEIPSGCTDYDACNFNEDAVVDDGSCIPSGCMDLEACNYNALAECEGEDCDYSCCPGPGCCLEGTVWDTELGGCIPVDQSCPHDLDFDGVVGVNDLMELLSAFGTDCPELEEPATSAFTCGDPVSYHGYDYTTVIIGDQCWFAENLRTEHYANGDVIPEELTDSDWSNTMAGAQVIYNNDASNLANYGRLYNWYAVDDSRGLCPSGWHVPTDGEIMTLEMQLGMSESDAHSAGWRGTDQGTQMKSSPEDSPSWNGTNSSGFSALPGGYRHDFGGLAHLGNFGCIWSASSNNADAWFRMIGINSDIDRNSNPRGAGFSVRCVLNE